MKKEMGDVGKVGERRKVLGGCDSWLGKDRVSWVLGRSCKVRRGWGWIQPTEYEIEVLGFVAVGA